VLKIVSPDIIIIRIYLLHGNVLKLAQRVLFFLAIPVRYVTPNQQVWEEGHSFGTMSVGAVSRLVVPIVPPEIGQFPNADPSAK
jgi:hypothetical protein